MITASGWYKIFSFGFGVFKNKHAFIFWVLSFKVLNPVHSHYLNPSDEGATKCKCTWSIFCHGTLSSPSASGNLQGSRADGGTFHSWVFWPWDTRWVSTRVCCVFVWTRLCVGTWIDVLFPVGCFQLPRRRTLMKTSPSTTVSHNP